MGSGDLSVVVPAAGVVVTSAGVVVAPVEGNGCVFTTLVDGWLVGISGVIRMRTAKHTRHQTPLTGKVALNFETFVLRNYPVYHNELSNLTLALLIIFRTSGSFPAAELNAFGSIVGVMGTIAVDSSYLTIKPAIATVLITHGGFVEVPVVIILRHAVVGVVNPPVKMSDPVVITAVASKYPVPIICVANDLLAVRSGVPGDREDRKLGGMVIETLCVISLPKNVFLVVVSSVVEIDHTQSIQGVGEEARIGLYPIEVSGIS